MSLAPAQEPFDDREKPTPTWSRPAEPMIHRASRKGQVGELERLLDEGGDLEERADVEHDQGPFLKGLTPLMIAARSVDGADTALLRWLVEHGADLSARSQGEVTATWYAAGSGGRWWPHEGCRSPDHVERLRYLLSLGSDPNECASNGRSLVTEACDVGDPDRLELLLEHGATVRTNAESDSYQLPLHLAAASGNAECVRLVIGQGVEPDGRDSGGTTALMMAGSVEVVRLLIESGSDPSAVDSYGNDALQCALEDPYGETCDTDVTAVATALLDSGVDLEWRDEFEKTRLMSAAFGHHDSSVALLLELGTDPQARDGRGATALHSICWQGESPHDEINQACERVIDLLIGAGIDPDGRDQYARTPMHEAAEGDSGSVTAIRVLVRHGANPDPVDNSGKTPLMLAASQGESTCIQALLEAGADPLRRSGDTTIIEMAEHHLQILERPDFLDSMREIHGEIHGEICEMKGNSVDPSDECDDDSQSREVFHQNALISAREVVDLLKKAASHGKTEGGG